MAFTFETSGNNTFLVYEIGQEDRLDTMTLGMVTNNRIPGMVPVLYTQMNRERYLKYNVTARVTARQFFSGVINRRRLFGVFFGVTDALAAAEEYMIDTNSLLLDAEYIYVDVSTCKAEVVCLPLFRETEKCDAVTFFKNIMFTTQFDQTENCDYVARIISYLNSAVVFVAEDFRKLLEQLQTGEDARSAGARQTEPLHAGTVQGALLQETAQRARGSFSQAGPQPASREEPGQGASSQVESQPGVQSETAVSMKNGEKVRSKYQIRSITPEGGGEKGFAVPGKDAESGSAAPKNGAVQQKTDSRADSQSPSEKKMSMLYLLQHYNKENVAVYKAQKEAQKKAGKAASGGKAGSESKDIGFHVPGQQSIPQPSQQAVPSQQAQPQEAVPLKQIQPQRASELVQPSVQRVSQGVKPAASANDNFGDTMIIDAGSRDTIVLGSTVAPVAKPYLHRFSTQERIFIDKPVFHIGKERSYVDYCVSGNATISRSHADIISRDGQYFIVDNNSTNHTYVDGDRIPSNKEIPLAHGTKIRMSDEEFEFMLF